MPYRFEPCCTGGIYHVFNRSVAQQNVFRNDGDYRRFFNLLSYYRFSNPKYRFSQYNRLPRSAQEEWHTRLIKQDQLVDILSFCIMPNHFHMLLRQRVDGGIQRYARVLQNGYAKYFNVKTKRFGAVFQAMYKAVLIEKEEQLLHVARYIHLNPLTSCIVSSFSDLERYQWDSFAGYLGTVSMECVEQQTLISLVGTSEKLRTHTIDQADYQRLLFVESHLYHD